MEPKFILNKKKILEQYNKLKDLNLIVSYSYKTNREVGNVLQDITTCFFSIHNIEEINMIKDKKRIWFFSQAWNEEQIKEILKKGVRDFVIDDETDLKKLLNIIKKENIKINLSLRMKFQEHRIGSGKYFVYGLSSLKINKIINKIKDNQLIHNLGIHIHRKSQNTNEWNMIDELKDSLTKESLKRINSINLGGGLPVKYKTYSAEILPYILNKLKETQQFLQEHNIETIIEPGRFIAAPAIKLETEIIQIKEEDNIIIINCSIYNSALDTVITDIRMLIDQELPEDSKGHFYLIKGNTPTRDDIFRYKVRLKNPKIGDKITFLNAGAYNYTTDFCSLKKLKTIIVEDF